MDHNKEFNTALLEYMSINSTLGDIESKIISLKAVILKKVEIQYFINQFATIRNRMLKNIFFLREKFALTEKEEKGYLSVNLEIEKLEQDFKRLDTVSLTDNEIKNLIFTISSWRKKIMENTKYLIRKFELSEEKIKICDTLLQNIADETKQYNLGNSEDMLKL